MWAANARRSAPFPVVRPNTRYGGRSHPYQWQQAPVEASMDDEVEPYPPGLPSPRPEYIRAQRHDLRIVLNQGPRNRSSRQMPDEVIIVDPPLVPPEDGE